MSDAATDPVRHALWLDAMEQLLRPCLPPALAPHCKLGNVTGGKLVFIVDSPVWHAKLRLAAPELINLARSVGFAATEVVAKTTTAPFQRPPAAGLAVKPMSEATRNALKAALASLDSPASDDPNHTGNSMGSSEGSAGGNKPLPEHRGGRAKR